jgi:hypothetical protein
MWHSRKRLLVAGALVVLAGTRSSAQDPITDGQENLQVLPALSAPSVPMTVLGTAPASALSAPIQEGAERLPAPNKARQPVAPETPCATSPQAPCAASPQAPCTATGAHPTHQHSCVAYRTDYQSPPLGSMMYQAFQIQVDNGIAARMILRDYDFVCGREKLNSRGGDYLRQIVHFWKSCSYPLTIERTPYAPGLAQARRLAVLSQLAEEGISIPPELVVVGGPLTLPLRGLEAEIIYQNLLQQSQNRGYLLGGGQGQTQSGSSTSSGQGSSGSGTTGSTLPR